MTPDATAIHAQLERILSSATFSTAGRHSRLLRYLVERTLAGEGDQLKEYVLGTEVFDRPDSYDPRIDSIVRVEVRRLRTRLEEYYRAEGVRDPVRIGIPRGGYVPLFTPSPPPADRGTAQSIRSDDTPRRPYSPVVIIAAALSVAIVMLAAGLVVNTGRTPAEAASGIGIAVLPFEHYSTREQDALLVARLTDVVTAELASLGTVSVASRTSASRYAPGRDSVIEIAKALNVDYVVEASASVTGEHIEVVARLVDGRRDRKVWVGEYAFTADRLRDTARAIARESAAALDRVQRPPD
jgi:TolB-like protein